MEVYGFELGVKGTCTWFCIKLGLPGFESTGYMWFLITHTGHAGYRLASWAMPKNINLASCYSIVHRTQ